MHQAPTSPTQEMRIIRNLGHLGHYLYITRGCRGGQQFILTALYREGDMTQKDLLARTKNASASLSEMVSKLEAKGLIERTRVDKDRRQTLLSLTKEGRKQAQEAQESIESFEAQALSVLSDKEKNVFCGYLDRLVEHWDTCIKDQKGETTCQKK
ncbi:MAG: MarR family transcriptional regulator [Atopobium sp.]|nr:MarR family transcriptional regulator [Atopobium sp.]